MAFIEEDSIVVGQASRPLTIGIDHRVVTLGGLMTCEIELMEASWSVSSTPS